MHIFAFGDEENACHIQYLKISAKLGSSLCILTLPFFRAIFTSILQLSSILLLLYAEQLTYFFNISFLSLLVQESSETKEAIVGG